jgi:hypothetical protein
MQLTKQQKARLAVTKAYNDRIFAERAALIKQIMELDPRTSWAYLDSEAAIKGNIFLHEVLRAIKLLETVIGPRP